MSIWRYALMRAMRVGCWFGHHSPDVAGVCWHCGRRNLP